MTQTRACPKCGETKSRESFSKDSRRKDGLHCWCRACRSVYRTQQNRKKHELAGTTLRIYGDDAARWHSYLSEPDENGCVLWMGTRYKNGYGYIGITTNGKSRLVLTHRYAYQQVNGPIPPGAVIHHTCHVRACVNPDHLVKASHSDNLIESAVVVSLRARVKELEDFVLLLIKKWET